MITERYTIFTAPEILTMNEAAPRVEAVCVSGGVVRAVGGLDKIKAFAGKAEEIHFEDGVLLPGFIDTHSHLSMYAQCRNQFFCDLSHGSVSRIIEGLRAQAASHPDAEWVMGYAYDDTGMTEQRHLTRHDLDAVSQDRPVCVSHITSHMGYLNTLGMQKLGVSADMSFDGGTVVIGNDGQPSGMLMENAYFWAFRQIPGCDFASLPEIIEGAVEDYNRAGFVAFQDGGIGFGKGAREILRAYSALAREGRLNARGYLHFMPSILDELRESGLWGLPLTDYLFYGGAKLFADGSIQSLTAVLGEPYACRPGFCGDLVATPEEIAELIVKYHCLGIPVAVHANGDAAIEYVTRGFERALEKCPRKVPGHMIVHVQMASDKQLARLHACGVTPTFFARHLNVWGERHVNIFLGEERAARLNPCGSCVRMGIPFGLHVDSPVQPVDAVKSMHTAVNRATSKGRILGPEQRVSPLDAVKGYTINAARCSGRDQALGKIAPGYFADFTHLSGNPLAVEPEAMETLSVRHTVSGGRVVYEAR